MWIWKNWKFDQMINIVRLQLFLWNGFACISWYFNDSKTELIHCEGDLCIARGKIPRIGWEIRVDTGSKASFDKRSGQERWDNDRPWGRERDRPPLVSSESSCCARARSAKKYFARYPRRGHVTRKRAWIEAQPLFDGVQFRQREDSNISIVRKWKIDLFNLSFSTWKNNE